MAAHDSDPAKSLVLGPDQPLFGILVSQDGREVAHYFTDETVADAPGANHATQSALSAIGSWSDLDWQETIETLDRIRHDSVPTPPLEQL